MEIPNPRNYALKTLSPDKRDFSHSLIFGSVADLPTHDFLVAAPLEIKDQDINYVTDYCTSYGASSVAEDEEQVVFCPEWTFAQGKALIAQQEGPQAFDAYGLDLRDICNAAQDFGFLPRIDDPFHCDTNQRPPRSILVNPANWPNTAIAQAEPYKISSYFTVDGPYDMFDNIRSVMWQNLGERRSVLVGAAWRPSWTSAPNGIIPIVYETTGNGHAFKICGQKTINGELRLIAQLSDGVGFGDNGFCYFSRETVNKEIGPYGAFTFSDLPKNTALWHVTNGVSIFDPLIYKCWKMIAKYIGL